MEKNIKNDIKERANDYYNLLEENKKLIFTTTKKYQELYKTEIKTELKDNITTKQLTLLDEIMFNFIELQVVAKNHFVQPDNEVLTYINRNTNETKLTPIVIKTVGINQHFRNIKTQAGEIYTEFFRSNKFFDNCQREEIHFKPTRNIIEYVLKTIN